MQLDLVDVFGSGPMKGNPLGVVRGAEGMDDAQMLALTQWLGFSETTFLLPPTDPAADYRVRIFYPAGELPLNLFQSLPRARPGVHFSSWFVRPGGSMDAETSSA